MRMFHVKHCPGQWLSVQERGTEGPSILFVHGATGSWLNFEGQMDELSRDFRVFAYDQRGHGDSPWPGPSSFEDFYRDLEELAAWLPRPFYLVGHSFGGSLAARLAARHPEWVRKLALINTCARLPRGLSFRFLQLFAPAIDWVALPRRVLASPSRVTQHMMHQTVRSWDVTEDYKAITLPTEMLLGGLDPLVPVSLGLSSARMLANGEARVLPWGGHVSMWDHPQQVTRWLSGFFRGPVGAAAPALPPRAFAPASAFPAWTATA